MSNIDLTKISEEYLAGLSEEERASVLAIVKEVAEKGNSDTLNNIFLADYEETPADITTFLHDKKYLGNALYDADGRFTLFPYWEETLKKIFPDNFHTAYNTLVLTGAIGLGKSTIAVICLLYMLHRLLCLKDPYLYYGMQPIDKITISLMNITLENAKGVALDKMNQMILSSEWFMAHGEMSGETNLIYRPDKHIELITASSNNQVIGRAIFCLDGDTKILTTKGEQKIKDLVDTDIKVISVDDNNKVVASDACTVKPTIKTNEEYEIELEDGTVIKCTADHLLMLADGTYKVAKDLTEEDELAALTPFGYIYKFTNLVTNKIYIGKREKPKFDESYYGSGKAWKADLKKCGRENITREIICFANSRQELNELERYYIKLYNTQNPDIGYNIHKGGQGGNSLGDTEAWSKLHLGEHNGRYHMEVSQETRDKISKANTGRYVGIKNPKKGRPGIKKPDGFGERVSKATKGKLHPWGWKRVLCVETGIIYQSLKEAGEKTGFFSQNIGRACRESRTIGGYHWRYIDEN